MKSLFAVAGRLQAIVRHVGRGRRPGVGQRLNHQIHTHNLRLELLEDRTLLNARPSATWPACWTGPSRRSETDAADRHRQLYSHYPAADKQ